MLALVTSRNGELSIVLAVLFAYVVNARFVFKARPETVMEELQAFVKFVEARALTMFVELGVSGCWWNR